MNINGERKTKWTYIYSVVSALLLIDNGNTSLGKTQAIIGPRETPYAAVNVYIPLYT